MFSFFHKKKHSPGDSPEDTSQPIPRAEDDYVVINKNGGDQPNASDSLYPSINPSGPGLPYPGIGPQGNVTPQHPKKEENFLQGVPFSLSKELTMNSNEMANIQLSEIMAFVTRKLQVQPVDYDFSVEKSVLLENC